MKLTTPYISLNKNKKTIFFGILFTGFLSSNVAFAQDNTIEDSNETTQNQPNITTSQSSNTLNNTSHINNTQSNSLQLNQVNDNKVTARSSTDQGETQASSIHTVNVNTVEQSQYTSKNETHRGENHIRQSLGFAVPANTNVYLRSTEIIPKKSITAELVTIANKDDRRLNVQLDHNWYQFSAPKDAGLFIRTPHTPDLRVNLEYYFENDNKIKMPHYQLHDDKKQFDKEWGTSQAPFAIAESEHVQMFIPVIDRDFVANLNSNTDANIFKSLDETLLYYEDVLTKYNKWLGLDNSQPEHVNSKQQYFVRADKTGYGAAYYTYSLVGTNSEHITPYFYRGWLMLHEIGHGYDGINVDPVLPDDMELAEVWNNIYGNLYVSTIDSRQFDWLYNGNQEKYQENVIKQLKSSPESMSFNKIGLRERLNIMATMLRGTGVDDFISYNQYMRANHESVHHKSINDNIAQYWGINKNVIPYLELFGVKISDSTKNNINAKPLPFLYPLSLLTHNTNAINKVLSKHHLANKHELVTNEMIQDSGVVAHNQVVLDLNHHKLQYDPKVSLISNGNIIATSKVINGRADFSNIPVGIYQILPPYTENGTLPNSSYIVFSELQENPVTLIYPTLNVQSVGYKEHITGLGLGNSVHLNLDYNPQLKTMSIQDKLESPHVYFSTTYMDVKVESKDGQLKYVRTLIGNQNRPNELRNQDLKIEYGDKLIIYHAEPDRLRFDIPELNTKTKQTTYIFTQFGLIKENEDTAYNRFKNYINENLTNYTTLMNSHIDQKYYKQVSDLYVAMHMLNEIDSKALHQQFNQLFKYYQLDSLNLETKVPDYAPVVDDLPEFDPSQLVITKVPDHAPVVDDLPELNPSQLVITKVPGYAPVVGDLSEFDPSHLVITKVPNHAPAVDDLPELNPSQLVITKVPGYAPVVGDLPKLDPDLLRVTKKMNKTSDIKVAPILKVSKISTHKDIQNQKNIHRNENQHSTKVLPQTGEHQSKTFIFISTVLLGLGMFLFRTKKVKQ
ncbi:putative mucin/carbohydrate-binding domain-containing protein [Mammaliicoccus stepanovicii]|uniref:Putative protease n=1 Tax=Mammaliicoccus stepanovicii TaxID=643214 RepID=A0A239ZC89_9STAP|nr:putative mucin/carbohydrate-binding domain-containing protein [Mammaliicoccus stepanovicii]GGI42124.1 hypothetical protein GCM10010896_16850 [Mammaliicoccus stepanovicii]SNV68344.1 putative protease [Mammaliicoccus stepanovicii]